ncbi:MAG: hypothetical protein ACREQ9_12400 [Candidatus Binatia bacterium]
MTMISNKTRRPLAIALPRGKTLHLGPGKTGEIAATAVEHPAVKKLIDAGEIEVVGEGSRPRVNGGGGGKGPRSTRGHASGGTVRSSGDR